MTPHRSLFEELSQFTSMPSEYAYDYATQFGVYEIRRLVLSRNVAAINSLLQETIQLTGEASIGVGKIADFNFDTFEQRAWVDEWRGDYFTRLWLLREDLEFQGHKLQQNLRVINKTASSMPFDRALELQEKEDLSEWNDLEDLRLYAFKIIERTTDSYLQTVQATGAQFANMQSKRFDFLLDNILYNKLIGVIVSHD